MDPNPPITGKLFQVDRVGIMMNRRTSAITQASYLFQPESRTTAILRTRDEMFKVARYWLEKKVCDGFRLDIYHSLFKDEQFRDNPFSFKILRTSGPFSGIFSEMDLHPSINSTPLEHAKELRSLIDSSISKKQEMLIGELFGDDAILKDYLGEGLDGLNLIFLLGFNGDRG